MRAQLCNAISQPLVVGPPRRCQVTDQSCGGVFAVERAQRVSLQFNAESFNTWAKRERVRDSRPMDSRVYRFVDNDGRDPRESLLMYEWDIKHTCVRICGKDLPTAANDQDPRQIALREPVPAREPGCSEIECREHFGDAALGLVVSDCVRDDHCPMHRARRLRNQ